MMYDIEDLKSRALVESNILKQFILSTNAQKRGEFKPQLDDLLIHEYQMANSVTLNVILSNYMVDLAHVVELMLNPENGEEKDSYFKLVHGLDENTRLDDRTCLILDLDEGDGSFKTRELVNDLKQIWDGTRKVSRFENLDSIWYCIEEEANGNDQVKIVDQMNDFLTWPNPFGCNPFDAKSSTVPQSFNEWMTSQGKLNCIVANRFYKNNMEDEGAVEPPTPFAEVITNCRYLVCVENGFYGLESKWDINRQTGEREFSGFEIHDIGELLPILGKDFTFNFCSFHVIGDSDETTLFLSITEKSGPNDGKYHYLYLNESSLDETYGFTEIDSVVVDQLIVPPVEVFSKVESIRDLDNVNIAMTDYGFWDIEANHTNSTTYSYKGGKRYQPVGRFNEDVSKLVTPTTSFDKNNQKVVEFCDDANPKYAIDRIWKKNGSNWYYCAGLPGIDPSSSDILLKYKNYRSSIVGNKGSTIGLFGCTENFAIYDSGGSDPIHILVNLSLEQFINLLYSDAKLTTYFIEWLYEQVTNTPPPVKWDGEEPIEWAETRGEWYLYNNYNSIAGNINAYLNPSQANKHSFTGMNYQVTEALIPNTSKFSSVRALVEDYTEPNATTLMGYCDALYRLVNDSTRGIANWLLKNGPTDSQGKARLENAMYAYFCANEWDNKVDSFAKDGVDGLVEAFPLLAYFESYLDERLKDWLSNFDQAKAQKNLRLVTGEESRVCSAVREYIKTKVGTSLVLGGYRNYGANDNTRYPGIEQYIYQNQRKLTKVQARDIMSYTNTLKEIMFGVQSTPFFKDYSTFNELAFAVADETTRPNLFKMSENEQFVALSNLVKIDGKTLDVNWNTIENWLFGISPNNHSNEKMLQAFIRTQIYRPLFFKYNNYVNFTSNDGVYKCFTDKFFVDHDGNEHKLTFDSNQNLNKSEVKTILERPEISNGEYTVPEDTIQYFNISNKFEYFIYYNPLEIVDNKFVLNDVEFYVVHPDGGESTPVNSIYFNEFQNNLEGQNQVAIVNGNRFTLNGKEFVIEGNEISVDSATSYFDGNDPNEKEWKCDIVDDQFQYDGTWYVLAKDNNGNYVEVKYSDPEDNKLVTIYVTSSGYAEYKPWGLTFQFTTTGSNAWKRIQVIKKHQSDVIDRFTDEWCAFDDVNVELTPDKTYMWWLANEIVRIQKTYLSQYQALSNLGSGILYNGGLELATKPEPPTECRLHIRNELQNGDVVTVCELVKKYGENDLVEFMGTLFDRDLNLDTGRVFRGDMANGLADENGLGSSAIFMKTYDGGFNNINCAWCDYTNWANSWSIVPSVAHVNLDDETQELDLSWEVTEYLENASVKFSPIYKLEDDENDTNEVIKYVVTIDNGVEQYEAWVNGDYVHFIVNGNRFRLKVSTNVVDRLVVDDLSVETLDFSSSYTPDQLRDNLVQNVKQAMLYFIVQEIMDNHDSMDSEIKVKFNKELKLYSDLFTDTQSLENYIVAWNLDSESENCTKFSQVYKNNLVELDDTNLKQGFVYQHLASKINATFGDKTNILVVDSPSIEVRRVSQVDTFKYDVLMNLHLMQNKDLMKQMLKGNRTEYEKKFILGNAIVHDMHCIATFTPKYDPNTGTMTYDATYEVKSGNHDVTYNQIIYNLDGKTKHKTISPSGKVTLNLDMSAFRSGHSDQALTSITKELLQDNIDGIFTYERYSELFKYINNHILSGTREVIDNNIVNNPGKANDIWELGSRIEVPDGGELLSVNRGSTYIRGEQYNVQDEDPNDMSLSPVTGNKTYKIEDVEVHEYEAMYIVGMVCPASSGQARDPKRFMYVKSYNESTQAFEFTPNPNDVSSEMTFATVDGCQTWISEHSTGSYTGLDFTAIQIKKPSENKKVKVATSEYTLVDNSYFASNNLTINRIGEGNDKYLFLTHRAASGLPNRYDVRSVDSMAISTNSIVNLEEYERSIRLDNSEDATTQGSAKNLVYKATSPGFCEAFGPTGEKWLERTGSGSSTSPYDASLKAIKIRDYRGFEFKKVGVGLGEGGLFTVVDEGTDSTISVSGIPLSGIRVVRGTKPQTGEENVLYIDVNDGNNYYWEKDAETNEYGFVETDDQWDGQMYIPGSFNVEITGLDTNSPKFRVTGCTKCHSIQKIPDTRGNLSTLVCDMVEYTPEQNYECPASLDVYTYTTPSEDPDAEEDVVHTVRAITFQLLVRKETYKLALNIGKAYTFGEKSLYINPTTLSATYYIPMMDFSAANVGLLGYCYISLPRDIDDASDKAYYETLLTQTNDQMREQGLPELASIQDVPHRGTGEYTYYDTAYFKLSGNEGNTSTPTIPSDGLDYPVSLDVLAPNKAWSTDGDVFNRRYEVQTKVYAYITQIGTTSSDWRVWIDKASMVASIRASVNKTGWRNLIYNGINEDQQVPPRMRESVQKLIDKITFLDKVYFELALKQLETFWQMIRNELWEGLTSASVQGVRDICNFAYYLDGVKFKTFETGQSNWCSANGLFGYDRNGDKYTSCRDTFDAHLLDEFKSDWKTIQEVPKNDTELKQRDYFKILLSNYKTLSAIQERRNTTLKDLWEHINLPPTPAPNLDIIDQIFKKGTDETWSNMVRYINAMKTQLTGSLCGMFVANDICNLFVEFTLASGGKRIQWYTFNSEKKTADKIVQDKIGTDADYQFEPVQKFTQYNISKDGWLFKMLNRDFVGNSNIDDAFAIHCSYPSQTSDPLWYVPQLGAYVYGAESTGGVFDLAYEQYGNRLYVLFNGDNHLYAYDDVQESKTFDNFIILKKEVATLKLVTFNSMCITDDNLVFHSICIDYFKDEENYGKNNWNLVLHGKNTSKTSTEYNRETWYFRPGDSRLDFLQYNSIMFGDSLFDKGQLRFHNISKNKDMFDILDVNEIGDCYYGLFKNEDKANEDGRETYTVFKAASKGGVVQRLPWEIVEPHMYRTNDDLYSLYVVSNEPEEGETWHPVLREVSVPDGEEYPERVIDIYKLYKDNNGDEVPRDIGENDDLVVKTLIMDEFQLKSKSSKFFALTNKGFHQIGYKNQYKQLSIDKMDGKDVEGNPIGFRDKLAATLRDIVVGKHIEKKHKSDASYFSAIARKVNQFDEDFSVFHLVPTEFNETQDVGVVPNSPITDVDDEDDHRDTSILTSTDILNTDGMVAQTDTNPGIVTCAVSNPATIYDDDTVFTKSQRNPSIEGTEFYDYIYDQNGNALMDLYEIPYIYRINSNNTYDLYVNVPTTRTKYLNRIAGTLTDNGTSQVLADDTRTRINFLDEMMSNNLDESTTRLQLFIDKKYISIGTVELVEISGNSIPTQIYRDVPNNGLYDSIALESRWTGEVTQIDEPSKDINKVMLEFECYGTDSQSIHIQGKTLVNQSMNTTKYNPSQDSTPVDPIVRLTLNFDPNGGVCDETSRTVVVGEVIGELPSASREDWHFDGWWTSPEPGMGLQIYSEDVVSGEYDTLYAHWDDGWTIFTLDDGTVEEYLIEEPLGKGAGYWFSENGYYQLNASGTGGVWLKNIVKAVIGHKVRADINPGERMGQGITNWTFQSIPTLETVIIRDGGSSGNMNMGVHVFDGCTNLKRVEIGNRVVQVGSYQFTGCTSLTDIVLPNNMQMLDEWMFRNCTSLVNLTIPESVKYVRENVFSGCSHLNRVLFLGKTTEQVRNIPYSSSNPQKSYPWGLPASLTPASVIVGELST